MIDPIQILWQPVGAAMPNLGTQQLVDISDGDTPNIRMPIRMLSADTPEITARSPEGAEKVDQEFLQLAEWIKRGVAPISKPLAEVLIPKLETGNAGILQFQQGQEASSWFKERSAERLKRDNKKDRNLFIMASKIAPFDNYNRLLALVAPSYTEEERAKMTRKERATFNLELVGSGWAAPFIIYPNIPGERDLPLAVEAAVTAETEGLGQYSNALSMPAYEYRMCEKLYDVTAKIKAGMDVSERELYGWRTRYVADMRDRRLYGPEDYNKVPQPYRLWFWPSDTQEAIGTLNLKLEI